MVIVAMLIILAPACGTSDFDVWVVDGSPPAFHWDEQRMNYLAVSECTGICEEGRCTSVESSTYAGIETWSVDVGRDGKGYFDSPLLYGVPPAGSDAWPAEAIFDSGKKALPLKASATYLVEVELLDTIGPDSWKAVTRGAVCFTGID